MSADFFGEPVVAARVVAPLVAVSEVCYMECDGFEDEYPIACRDAILEPGSTYVVSCPNYVEGECGVSRTNVGELDEDDRFRVAGHFAIERHMSEKVAEVEGLGPTEAERVVEGMFGTTSLLHAIAQYGFREYQ